MTTYQTKWLSKSGVEWFDDARTFATVEEADKNADMQIEAMLNDGEEPPEYLGAFPVVDVMQARAEAQAILAPLGFERRCTGGNCFAWSKTEGGREILITTADDNQTEDVDGSGRWICGVFDDSTGDELDGIDVPMTLTLLLAEMRKAKVLTL